MKRFNKLKSVLIVTTAFFTYCSSNNNVDFPNCKPFKEGDIHTHKLTSWVKLDLFPIINIRSAEIFDTLIICLGKSTANDFQMHIYSLKSCKLLKSFCEIGRGPDELIQLTHFQIFHKKSEIIVPDNGSQRIFIYRIDSLLTNDRNDPFKVITLPEILEGKEYDFAERKITIANGPYRSQYMIDDKNYLQVVSHPIVPLIFVKTNIETREILGKVGYPELPFLDTVVNVAHLVNIFSPRHTYNSYGKKLVIVYNKTDLIEIYDSNLNMITRLHGPDQFLPRFGFESFSSLGSPMSDALKLKADSELDLVRDIPGIARRAYSTPVATKNGFFVRYSGNLLPLRQNDPPIEYNTVYQFNYMGKLIKKYFIDIKTALMTVDSDEKWMLIKDVLGEYYLCQLD